MRSYRPAVVVWLCTLQVWQQYYASKGDNLLIICCGERWWLTYESRLPRLPTLDFSSMPPSTAFAVEHPLHVVLHRFRSRASFSCRQVLKLTLITLYSALPRLRLRLLHRHASINENPCTRGHSLSPGDSPLLPGECIEGRFGFRRLGWVPGFSWRPRLEVRHSGEVYVSRPDGSEVRQNTAPAKRVLSAPVPSPSAVWIVFCCEALPRIVRLGVHFGFPAPSCWYFSGGGFGCMYHGYVPGIIWLQVIRDGTPQFANTLPWRAGTAVLVLLCACFLPSRRFFV